MREPSTLDRPGQAGSRAPSWFLIGLVSATTWGLFLSGATLATALAQEGPPPLQVRKLPHKAPPPATQFPAKIPGDTAEPSTSRLILSQLLYRSRPQQVALEQATAAFQSGKSLDGLTFLQQALDTPHDSFQWHSEDGLSSARREAREILSAQSEETHRLYERLQGPEANRLLHEAEQANHPELYRTIAKRFFHTEAGFKAVDWQAAWWLDRGEFELAAHAWGQLLSDPVHKQRVTDSVRAKAKLAASLAQHDAAPTFAPDRGTSEPIRTASLDEFPIEQTAYRDSDSNSDGRITLSSTFYRGKSSPLDRLGRAPYLKPTWGVNFAAESQEFIGVPLAQWEAEQIRGQRPIAVANFAHVVGKLVIVRDYDGIRAIDRDSGALVWRYVGASSLAQAARDLQTAGESMPENSSRQNILSTLFNLHSGNATLGTLSSDHERVYAVDHLDIRPRQMRGDPTAPTAVVAGRRSEVSRHEKLARESNRLIAIDLVQSGSSKETAVPAWTVGGAVGAINWFYRMDDNDDGRVTVDEFRGEPKQFGAIDRDSDGVIKASEADAYSNRSRPQHVLTGHFFLGPPKPVDGRLFAMTECDRQLNLVALDAATGGLLWAQGIGFVDHPVEEDPFRYTLSCSPIVAGGVVICPTQIGVLAGVDATDGVLLWAYYYGDDDSNGPFGNWSYAVRRSFGHQGFPSEPEVHGEHIVYMPRQSDLVHCLDLKTGRLAWKVPRSGAEYVAAVTDNTVMLVGQRYCRGMSLSNGEDQWSVRLGMPAGSGARVGSQYLVPLQEGRIATLEIETGREIGLSTPILRTPAGIDAGSDALPAGDDGEDAVTELSTYPSPRSNSWRPGNLGVSGDSILSVDSRQIVALPQSEPLLVQVQRELQSESPQAEQLLLAAELEATLGKVPAAKSHLSRALAGSLESSKRIRAEELLRELLYRELQHGGENESVLLSQLEKYLRSPADRGRFLMLKIDAQLRRNDFEGVLESRGELAQLKLPDMLPSAGDSTHFVSMESWTSDAIGRFQETFDDDVLESIQTRIDSEQQAALAAGTIESLERFLATYSLWPQAAGVRTTLAQKLIEQGEQQRAELLLIETSRSRDLHAAHEAAMTLVKLWDRLGLPEEAATLWLDSQSNTQPADLASLRAMLPAGSLTVTAVERALGPAMPVSRVRISQESGMHSDPNLAEAYGQAGRQFSSPPGSAFQLVDKGNAGFGDISIIDRLTGVVVGSVEVQAPYSGSTLSATSQVGHFVPLGSGTTMHGISLLERNSTKPAWSVVPKRIESEVDTMMVGPTGPSFCVFQAHRHLIVTDPATGRILWQRTDIDPHSGLDADVYRGIIGDEEVLVVFGFDRASYTAYATRTGEEIRRGKLDVTSNRHSQERRVFGRMLFYFSDAGTEARPEKRMRLWDPLADRFLLDVPVSDSTVWRDTPDGEIVAVLPPNRLVIFDGRTGAVRVDRELEPERLEKHLKDGGTFQVAAIRDHANYYVNLQPSQLPVEEQRYNYPMSDTVLPRFDVRGELLAINRETGKLAWSRMMPHRSLLRLPHVRLPFLIGMSLSGTKGATNRQTLSIEIVDAKTGETIGLEERAARNRILQFAYDHVASRIELRGEKSVINLDFGANVKPFEALTEQN